MVGASTTGPASTGAFPRAEAYLARLPRGFDSYPECTARASVFRVFSESRSLRGFSWREVHPKIATTLRTPLPPSGWLPEVSLVSSILAMADHLGLTDDEAVRWFADCSTKLLSNRMYAALISLASPAMLVRSNGMVWRTLHRGVGFGMVIQDRGANVSVTFPPFLHNDLVMRAQGEGIRLALEMSRARNCSYEIVRATPRSCEYRFDWT